MWFSIYALAGTPNVWRTHPYIAASPLFITFLILYVSGTNLPCLPEVCSAVNHQRFACSVYA